MDAKSNIFYVHEGYRNLGIVTRKIKEGDESIMISNFLENFVNSYKSSNDTNLMVFQETKINNSYPDLLLVSYNPDKFISWNKFRNKISKHDLKILYYLCCNSYATIDTICRDTFFSFGEIERSLKLLLDANIIDTDNKNIWSLNKKYFFGVKNIECIEAKISNINKVIDQAFLNTTFASESYILVRRKLSINDYVLEKAKHFGLGIYLYNGLLFRKCLRSKIKQFPSNYNSLIVNEFVGRILNYA